MIAQIVFFWIGGLFVAAFIGFLVLAMVVLAKFLKYVFKSFAGIDGGRNRAYLESARNSLCANDRCGQVNIEGARYCGRCGRPLAAGDDTDVYG